MSSVEQCLFLFLRFCDRKAIKTPQRSESPGIHRVMKSPSLEAGLKLVSVSLLNKDDEMSVLDYIVKDHDF